MVCGHMSPRKNTAAPGVAERRFTKVKQHRSRLCGQSREHKMSKLSVFVAAAVLSVAVAGSALAQSSSSDSMSNGSSSGSMSNGSMSNGAMSGSSSSDSMSSGH